MIIAPDRDATLGTARNGLPLAAWCDDCEFFNIALDHLYPVGLDQCVYREGGPGLPLAIAAVAAMHDQGV